MHKSGTGVDRARPAQVSGCGVGAHGFARALRAVRTGVSGCVFVQAPCCDYGRYLLTWCSACLGLWGAGEMVAMKGGLFAVENFDIAEAT